MKTWQADETVTVRGVISTIMWQHLMTSVPGKKSGYFDVDGESQQIVVYWKEAPKCVAQIEITGKVVPISGPSKRPKGTIGTKVDETYSELQLDVESARCVASP